MSSFIDQTILTYMQFPTKISKSKYYQWPHLYSPSHLPPLYHEFQINKGISMEKVYQTRKQKSPLMIMICSQIWEAIQATLKYLPNVQNPMKFMCFSLTNYSL